MQRDFESLDRDKFLRKYGHLRPGTYDIRSPRYDRCADQYFDWSSPRKTPSWLTRQKFALSTEHQCYLTGLLRESGLHLNSEGLFDFMRMAIEGREYGKFVFTETLSNALTAFEELGMDCGFSADDCSYADITSIREIYSGGESPKSVLARSIERGKQLFGITTTLSLPPLLLDAADAWSFSLPASQPNFVTQLSATGRAVRPEDGRAMLKDAILLVQSADPGYDWIFSCGIAGFITQFGGANSHMAIRANELRVPAVIGAGQKYFEKWASAERLRIDCANRVVHVLS